LSLHSKGIDELELTASHMLQELKRRLGWRAIALQGKKPSGLVAAMVYIIAKQKGLDVTQPQLSDVYNVSTSLIYNNRKLIEHILRDGAFTPRA